MNTRAHVLPALGACLALALAWCIALPSTASADTVQTQAILPAGAVCESAQISNFKPYIYDGELHSFDFDVKPATSVVVVGSVGNQSFPFYYVSRRQAVDPGSVRMHVDVPKTSLAQPLTISATMLETKGSGTPVCMTVATFYVAPVAGAPTTPAAPVVPTTPTSPQTPPTSSPQMPSGGEQGSGDGGSTPTTSATSSTSTDDQFPPNAMATLSSIKDKINDWCAVESPAYSPLLIVLALLYLAGVATLVWFKPSAVFRSDWRIAAAIIAPLVILCALWYVFSACRQEVWFPLALLFIAIAGSVAAYWNRGSTPSSMLPMVLP